MSVVSAGPRATLDHALQRVVKVFIGINARPPAMDKENHLKVRGVNLSYDIRNRLVPQGDLDHDPR